MENCQCEIDNVRKQLENVVAEMNLKKLIVDKTKEEVSVLCRLVTELESEKKWYHNRFRETSIRSI